MSWIPSNPRVSQLSDPTITSATNPLVKEIIALRRSNRHRRVEGRSVVEGFKILNLALDAGAIPASVLFDPTRMVAEEVPLVERARRLGSVVRAVSPRIMLKISAREGPLACVASVQIAQSALEGLVLHASPLLIAMEGLEKPGNLGALARTASAAGADALIAADSKADVYAPATIHSSLGAVFQLPIAKCASNEAIHWLRERGIGIVATSPSAEKAYYELDLTKPVAVAIGNEHRGLSDEWLQAGTLALIPMAGPMNSLNATIAGGIVLFEAVRQRALARSIIEVVRNLVEV